MNNFSYYVNKTIYLECLVVTLVHVETGGWISDTKSQNQYYVVWRIRVEIDGNQIRNLRNLMMYVLCTYLRFKGFLVKYLIHPSL